MPPQYRQRPSARHQALSSGVSFFLPTDKSIGPAWVPDAVVETAGVLAAVCVCVCCAACVCVCAGVYVVCVVGAVLRPGADAVRRCLFWSSFCSKLTKS